MTARAHEVCTEGDIDAFRFEVARVDVMAEVAMQHFDRTIWREADPAWLDFVAHLVAATAEAAAAALLTVDDLRRVLGIRRAVPSGEIWNDG